MEVELTYGVTNKKVINSMPITLAHQIANLLCNCVENDLPKNAKELEFHRILQHLLNCNKGQDFSGRLKGNHFYIDYRVEVKIPAIHFLNA